MFLHFNNSYKVYISMNEKKLNNEKMAEFDEYADSYEKVLIDQLSFFVNSRDYYSKYKVEIAANLTDRGSKKILDFGAGIGLSIPFLQNSYLEAEIYASDESEQSLEFIRRKYPSVEILHGNEIEHHKFDIIFIAGVFHHIAIKDREKVLKLLNSIINEDGKIIIFEHNPYNPLTQKIVSNCIFDADANLLYMKQLCSLINATQGLEVNKSAYTLFFPEFLKKLVGIEKYLGWLPLGGQYYVLVGKAKN